MRNAISASGQKRHQFGAILVTTLAILGIISVIALLSVRNASSSTQISNSARSRALALQAAESALRFCERAALRQRNGYVSGALTPAPAPSDPRTGYRWQNLGNWDGSTSGANLVTLSTTDLGIGNSPYRRLPECMAEYMDGGNAQKVVVTARGFGPEVGLPDSHRSTPVGTEIWLQSFIQMQ
jgi:type IV pilus assembly protein PilX